MLLILALPAGAFAPSQPAAPSRYLVLTDRGEFTLELMDVLCPLSAAEFRQRLDFGYYDGAAFARRPQGAVLQLGTWRRGEPAPDCRFEPEDQGGLNSRATVAWAISRQDGHAGYPFFINLKDNRALDGRYPVFAEVIDGFDTVLRLRPGDSILRIKPLEVSQ